MTLSFFKFHGAGNDFILIDNRKNNIRLSESQICHLCHRRFGIGADGLMMLGAPSDNYSFAMDFFNSDGKRGSMCGNGGRCITAFAHYLGISNYNFIAPDGAHNSEVLSRNGNEWVVKLQMRDVDTVTCYADKMYLTDTGSPHLVIFVNDIAKTDVVARGFYWRHHKDFGESGVNVNFVQIIGDGRMVIRTFERGVEDQTWACGTGATASAMAARLYTQSDRSHWELQAKGGTLVVDYTMNGESFRNVALTGPASLIFEGEVEI